MLLTSYVVPALTILRGYFVNDTQLFSPARK